MNLAALGMEMQAGLMTSFSAEDVAATYKQPTSFAACSCRCCLPYVREAQSNSVKHTLIWVRAFLVLLRLSPLSSSGAALRDLCSHHKHHSHNSCTLDAEMEARQHGSASYRCLITARTG